MSTPNEIANVEYEKFVLGAMLLKDGEIIPKIAAILNANDFYRPQHQIIFSDILKIYALKQPVNMLTLINFVRDNGNVDKVGLTYLFSLMEVAHTTAYADFYAAEIKQKADLRRLTVIAEKISAAAKGGLKSPLDIIAETSNELNSFNDNQSNKFSTVGVDLGYAFWKYIEDRKNITDRKTGFSNIDAVQFFEPGLYILGATPACGKTTFTWQLAEQLSERGEHCIFCSYEMPKFELEAKTIARKLFIDDPYTSLTAAQILRGGWSNELNRIIDEMVSNENFIVREFSDENVDKLLAILRPIVISADKPPVVFIDYLQRLIPRDGKADTRALIDDALFKLKDFSKETNTTFVVVSTFNRVNYNQIVDFESFKESGGIEYTADVVWAMQLNVANKLLGEKPNTIRDKLHKAKIDQPRQINLKCLKNRKGNIYDCYFFYHSAHDYFEPCNEEDFNIQGPPEKISDSDEREDD